MVRRVLRLLWFSESSFFSRALVLGPAGALTWTFAPYGERYATSGSPAWTFTGQTADVVSDEYDFMFREYHSTQGRWISPDPAGMAAVTLGNPQSWNRHAYVANTPLTATDELGLLSHWSDVAGTGRYSIPDPFRDPGGAAFAALLQQYRAQAGFGSPIQEALTGYLSSIPWYSVHGGELYSHFGFYTPNPGYDPNDPNSLLGTFTSVDVDLGPISVSGAAVAANNGLLSKLKNLVPSVCGGGGFGYGGAGGHAGPVHGEILGLVEYDSRLGGAHGGLVGAGAGHFTWGVESMRTWSDWQAHTTPIGLGGVEIPGATGAFGKQINTQSRDVGGLAQYENGNLSLGFYAGTTFGSGRAVGGGAYITLSWSGCHE